MLKKIFVLIIILLIVALGWYVFNSKQKTSVSDPGITASSTSIFPTINTIADSISGAVTNIISPTKPTDTSSLNSEIAGLLREIVRSESPNFILNESTDPSIVYIDNQTGNLFSLSLNDLKQKPVRISSMTILDIFNIDGIVKNNSLLVVLDTIRNNSELKKTIITKSNINGPTLTETGDISDNVGSSIVSPYNSYIYYTENMADKTQVYKIKAGVKNTVGELPLSGWKLDISGSKLIAYTYPDPSTKGYAYSFDQDSNKREKLIMGTQNLSLKVSPDYKKIIYSAGNQDSNYLYILDRTEKINLPLTISTFAEKCLWSNDSQNIFCAIPKKSLKGSDLTSWKRGEILFNDYFVSIDATTGKITNLDSSSIDQNIDAINLKYSTTLRALIFTNKADLHTYILGI
ncbi:MAG: hypothetical protein QG665_427 [Patescibacteria group bacterium]|nr:hypothetical protein [Patescibacteria group bacterium]